MSFTHEGNSFTKKSRSLRKEIPLQKPKVLWPKVRNPNTPSLCLAGPESPFSRGLETPIPHHCAWRDPKVLWPRVRNPNTPSLCLAGPESHLAEG
ncbi:Hypothetical protein FKW44_015751 [Caligus rogercresseyi]|uniref:Uncharacterized protein n=1 Tax=Caligus rogercresseyi TaxID=217165 RepID=A0A7T8K0V6_CALRO|nr:Hypothetical protein FKW44_015751 [Caligus rogercresseyi]